MFEKSAEWKRATSTDFNILNRFVMYDKYYIKPLYNQACRIYNAGLNDGVKGSLRDMCVGAGAYLATSLYRSYH